MASMCFIPGYGMNNPLPPMEAEDEIVLPLPPKFKSQPGDPISIFLYGTKVPITLYTTTGH